MVEFLNICDRRHEDDQPILAEDPISESNGKKMRISGNSGPDRFFIQ